MASKTLSSIIGGGGATLLFPSFTIIDPAGCTLKTNDAVVFDASVAGFWAALEASNTKKGFETIVKDADADMTEQTIVDVADEGVLMHTLAPQLSGTGFMTFRITIDGELTTIVSETIDAGDRFCAGGFEGHAATASSTSPVSIGSGLDMGFRANKTATMMPTPVQTALNGLIGKVFRTGLKVTVQGSVNITGTAQLKKCCANYLTSIPEGLL